LVLVLRKLLLLLWLLWSKLSILILLHKLLLLRAAHRLRDLSDLLCGESGVVLILRHHRSFKALVNRRVARYHCLKEAHQIG